MVVVTLIIFGFSVEFMIIPCKFETFRDSLRAGCEIFHALKELLISKNFSVSVGDEGGFAPNFQSNKRMP